MKLKLAAILIGALQAVAVAQAEEPTYTADDIVRHFAATASKSITRGICVGTEAECAVEKEEKVINAFDLMINFDKNSAQLTSQAQNNLLQFFVALNHPKLAAARFAIEGFTDASGSDRHNMNLSQRRAQSVVSYLTSMGVDTSRLEWQGFGETRMRVTDPLDPINRRVETHIIEN